MLRKIATLSLAVTALAGSAALFAAEAKPGHHGGHGGHFYRGPRFYYGPAVPVYPLVSDCAYSRAMWRRTGRNYWKWRYYECMGW